MNHLQSISTAADILVLDCLRSAFTYCCMQQKMSYICCFFNAELGGLQPVVYEFHILPDKRRNLGGGQRLSHSMEYRLIPRASCFTSAA